MAEQKEKVLIDIQLDTSDIDKSVVSLKTLAEANKKLREERKQVNIATEEGRKQVEQLNAQIDRNDKLIRENSTSLEKQRLNVGNYTNSIKDAIPALDKFTGGAASAATGIGGMVKQAIAFIATPFGAIIAALGLAFGALVTYIKGSDEAGDRFAKTTATLGVVFDKVKIAVESFGKVVFDVLEFVLGTVEKIINYVDPAAGAAIAAAKKVGEEIAKMQDDIDTKENEQIVNRAKVNAQVLKLREDAIKQEGEQKRATIQKAIDLEKGLAQVESDLAQKRLDLFKLENKARLESNTLGEDGKRKLAELEADVINKQSEGSQATIKFQKEIEKLREEEEKQKEEARKRDEDAAAFKEAANQKELDDLQKKVDAIKIANETEAQLNEKLNIDTSDSNDKLSEKEQKQLEDSNERGRKRAEWAKKSEEQRVGAISGGLQQAANLFAKDSAEYKVITTARAVIDTYSAANLALKSFPPPLGAVFAALNIATGLQNIAAINSVKFAEGGSVLGNGVRWGTVGGRSHSEGGTKYYGSDGNVVELERNEGFFVAKVDAHREFLQNMSGLNQKYGGNSWLSGRSPVRRFAEGGVAALDTSYQSQQLSEIVSQINALKVAVVIDEVEAAAIQKQDRVNRAQVV